MKYLFIFLVLFIGPVANTRAQTDSSELLLKKLGSQTITQPERKQLRAIAFDIQNRGQLLDEHDHDYAGSLALIDRAITIFRSLADTLNEANNRKFKGYLLGRFHKFAEGKAEIKQAIDLFQSKNAGWGVAVSQFDLSRLLEFEHQLDSALFHCNTAISYWKSTGNIDRIFLTQNMLINLLTKTNKFSEAKLLQAESSKIAEDPKQHWQGLLDFYVVSENLYVAAKALGSARQYKELYARKIAELKAEGTTASSYFEEAGQHR